MRIEFANWAKSASQKDPALIFMTGDLGYGAFEELRASMGMRFVNMGVSEQNMVTVAAGLAQQGLKPICYSIAPFVVFRAFEQIRLDVAIHNLSVKIVGNGGGFGYGIMGATHHALEDIGTLSTLQNFLCFTPLCNSDVPGACDALLSYPGPGYLRLGFSAFPLSLTSAKAFAPVRRLNVNRKRVPSLTIIGLGPVFANNLDWLLQNDFADSFAVSQLPLRELGEDLEESLRASGKVWIIEEHVRRGGLGEHIAIHMMMKGIAAQLFHSCAHGYASGLYGSQHYHLTQSGLDSESLKRVYRNI